MAIPVMLLMTIASCTKDEKALRVRNNVLDSKHQDRGFIIIAKEGAKLEAISENLSKLHVRNFKLRTANQQLGLIRVQTPDPTFPEKARQIANVESVVVDVVLNWRLPEKVFRSDKPIPPPAASAKYEIPDGDPFSYFQWDLESVKAPEAWAKGYKGKGATVAVLDGGFLLFSEIRPNILLTHSVIGGDAGMGEGFSQATHTAGIIAAPKDGFGVVGVAPEAKLMLIRVLNDDGSAPFSAVIDGIFYASNHGADVINMSFGKELPRKTYTDDNGTPDDPDDDYVVEYNRDIKDLIKAINRATLYATLNGTTLVAAAGDGAYNYDIEKRFITYPAAALGVLSIAANGPLGWGINQDTTLYIPAIYTNYGKQFVSYAAPGGNWSEPLNTTIVDVNGLKDPEYIFDFVLNVAFYSTVLEEHPYQYFWLTGTGVAAAHASGVIALLYGKNPRMNPVLVERILRKSSDDYGPRGKDAFFGNGQVNAEKAVSY